MKKNDEVLALIKKGASINKIKNITGHPKSSIYYHYKKILGKKQKDITIRFKDDRCLGEFLGIFAGDGSFHRGRDYHYKVKIFVGHYEKEYADYLITRFSDWFDKKPHVLYRFYKGKPSVIELRYNSRKIYDLIKKYLAWEGKKVYSVRLHKVDPSRIEFNLGFLCGLADTDGNYFSPKRRLSFATVSKKLARQVYNIIQKNIGIEPSMWVYSKAHRADLYIISISGDKALKVLSKIKPKNKNKNAIVV